MKRFNLKKLNDTDVKEQYNIKIVTALQLQKTWVIMWTSMGLGQVQDRTSQPQQNVYVIMS